MNKKKLIILPLIVVMIVAMMGISVLAAGGSATSGVKVYESDGSDVTSGFHAESVTGLDLSKVSGLQAKIDKVNNKLKVKDFKFKVGYEIQGSTGTAPWKVVFTSYKPSKNEVCIMIHETSAGNYDVQVFKGTGNYAAMTGVKSFSPFYLYTATAKSSAQTGDFAPAYIAMISVALITLGAIFAVRAKKATK